MNETPHPRDRHDPPDVGQQPLPFDDEADEPVPFVLTARARLEVAPDRLPPLTVVPEVAPDTATGDLDEPGDTRPARARALRRAGLPVDAIAAQLGADDLSVRAWVGEVVAKPTARPAPEPAAEVDQHRTAFELARADARAAVGDRLATDARFAAGLGLAAAIVETDVHAVTVTVADVDLAAHLLHWVGTELDIDPRRIRVVLRLGPDVSGDLARHRWARALDLPVEQVVHTRSRSVGTPDATEAIVRIADTTVAATLAGWRDALLAPADGTGPADIAF